MAYDVQTIEREFGRQYKGVDLSGSQRTMVAGAEGRWRNSVAAFEDAMKVQAGVVGNLGGARSAIDQLVTASQSIALRAPPKLDRKSTRLNPRPQCRTRVPLSA